MKQEGKAMVTKTGHISGEHIAGDSTSSMEGWWTPRKRHFKFICKETAPEMSSQRAWEDEERSWLETHQKFIAKVPRETEKQEPAKETDWEGKGKQVQGNLKENDMGEGFLTYNVYYSSAWIYLPSPLELNFLSTKTMPLNVLILA